MLLLCLVSKAYCFHLPYLQLIDFINIIFFDVFTLHLTLSWSISTSRNNPLAKPEPQISYSYKPPATVKVANQ